MAEILSLWRSPLDKVAFSEAVALGDRQPRGQLVFGEDLSPMTIYNYGFYIADTSSNPTHDFSLAITNMFTAMKAQTPLQYGTAGIGGTAFIPQGSFAVNTSSGFSVPDQCNIIGSGGGGFGQGAGAPDFFHFVVTPTGGAGGSIFLNCPSGNHTSGGKYFRSLAIEWGTTSVVTDTCISANTWNCRAVNCVIANCPIAFNAQGLSCGMEQCTIDYESGPNGYGPGPPGVNPLFAAVKLAASQAAVVGPGEYLQKAQTKTNAPVDTVCISFESNLEHGIVKDLHINHWSFGITYAISSHYTIDHCVVEGVEFSTFGSSSYGGGTCVHMTPSDSHGAVYNQTYLGCSFSLADGSTHTNPLIYIDTNGAGNNAVNDIKFLGCTAFQALGHGYQIHGGSNIQIIGGTSAGNGPSGGAGIAITGNCGRCEFIGVNLNAAYPNANVAQSQQYAFLCSASPSEQILLDGCSMKGYSPSAGAISVTGVPGAAELIIRNCPGYNDQNTTILSSASNLTVGTAYSAATAGSVTGGTNYYGPSLLVFLSPTPGGTSLTINGVSHGWAIPAGQFVTYYLASPYDTVQFSALPTVSGTFAWIGK